MRKLLVVMAVLAFSLGAAAQNKAEFFGGYSYFHLDTKGTEAKSSFHGWNAELAGKFNPNFGIVADISGHYNSQEISGVKLDGRVHNFLFGPRVYAHTGKLTPFAHAEFGVAHSTAKVADSSVSDNNFAMALGGGFDYEVAPGIAIRPAKFDYLYVKGDGDSTNNFRYSAGVVFRF